MGKQTIYRRWSSRAAVLVEAFLSQDDVTAPIPDGGSLRRDLATFAGVVSASASDESLRRSVAGLVAASHADPEVGPALPRAVRGAGARRRARAARARRGTGRGASRTSISRWSSMNCSAPSGTARSSRGVGSTTPTPRAWRRPWGRGSPRATGRPTSGSAPGVQAWWPSRPSTCSVATSPLDAP